MMLFVCLWVNTLQAQEIYNSSGRKVAKKPEKQKGFDIDKLVLGGDFRFNVGLGVSLGIAPMVGYKITDHFVAGVRLGYSYDRFKLDYQDLPASATTNVFSYNTYTGGLWTRYLIFETVYLHAEMEYNFFQQYYQDASTGDIYKKMIESPSLMIGAGFKQPISDRVSVNTTLLYDVYNDPYSYYHINNGSGFDFRMGFLIGF